jgi:guanidinoacetate N-methyltransferase
MAIEISENELLIGGWQVMQSWERPLMEAMADEVAVLQGDVLEIGYGMGIAAQMIVNSGCASYTVIEAHPAIAQLARAWASVQSIPCTILEGAWQDIVPRLSIHFDSVLFDTFPLSADERGKNHFPFIPIAPSLLRRGGIFVYYSDETFEFRSEHLAMLLTHFDEVKLIKVSGLKPGNDCEYWGADHMIVPVARRT